MTKEKQFMMAMINSGVEKTPDERKANTTYFNVTGSIIKLGVVFDKGGVVFINEQPILAKTLPALIPPGASYRADGDVLAWIEEVLQ